MDYNEERLKEEVILEQLDKIGKLIEEHEENTKYLRESIVKSFLNYCKCQDVKELLEKEEFEDLILSYKEVEPWVY